MNRESVVAIETRNSGGISTLLLTADVVNEINFDPACQYRERQRPDQEDLTPINYSRW